MTLSGCDAKPFPRIQLLPGGDWYYAKEVPYNYTIVLRDLKLQTTLGKHKCRAFDKNISLPDSPSISFKLITLNIVNFFKCYSTNPNITRQRHFHGYRMYNGCKGFSIYYNLHGDYRTQILPSNCSLIRLPIDWTSNDGDAIKMLSPYYYVDWKVPDACHKCHYDGGQCQTDKRINSFHCYRGTSKRGLHRKTLLLVATGPEVDARIITSSVTKGTSAHRTIRKIRQRL